MDELINIIRAAKGELKSSIIISNVDVVDVIMGDIREKVNIAIWNNYIVRVGYFDVDRYRGNDTLVIDGSRYEIATPGFIDPHIHVESSLLTVSEFAKLALIHGTTTVAADPHEVANVLGVEGVKLFIEESKYVPLRMFFYVPSCVPPTSRGLDTPGSRLTAKDVEELLKYEEVIGLGEVMDFLGVYEGSEELLKKVSIAKTHGKIADGHAPQLPEDMLIPYAAIGIRGDHESVFLDEALTKLRAGMRVLIREGSAWRDLEELSKIMTYMKINTRYLAFASDDLDVIELFEEGHMDRILRRAVSLGIDPITAVQLATINAAEYLGLSDEIGSLTPGKFADIVLLKDFRQFKVRDVIVNGDIAVIDGKYSIKEERRFKYPDYVYRTVNVKSKVKPEDLTLRIEGIKRGYAKILAVKVVVGKAITRKEVVKVGIEDGLLKLTGDQLYAAVIERHHATGNIGKGIILGLNLASGAIAQTIAHDVHNIIVVGRNPDDMAVAVNRLIDVGGGMVVVVNERVLSEVRLPIAGLMSDKPYEEIVKELKDYVKTLSNLNVNFRSVFMTISLLSLPVIPEIRITDKGVVDVLEGKIINPVLEVSS